MQRIEHIEDLIDLGAATVETQGDPGIYFEQVGLSDQPTGLADD